MAGSRKEQSGHDGIQITCTLLWLTPVIGRRRRDAFRYETSPGPTQSATDLRKDRASVCLLE